MQLSLTRINGCNGGGGGALRHLIPPLFKPLVHYAAATTIASDDFSLKHCHSPSLSLSFSRSFSFHCRFAVSVAETFALPATKQRVAIVAVAVAVAVVVTVISLVLSRFHSLLLLPPLLLLLRCAHLGRPVLPSCYYSSSSSSQFVRCRTLHTTQQSVLVQ